MTPEEFERTTDFILRHQADLNLKMESLTVKMESLTVKTESLAVKMEDLTGKMEDLTGKMGDLTGNMGTLTTNMGQLTVIVEGLTKRTDQIVSVIQQERELRIQGDSRLEGVAVQLADIARVQSLRLDRVEDVLDEHDRFLKPPEES